MHLGLALETNQGSRRTRYIVDSIINNETTTTSAESCKHISKPDQSQSESHCGASHPHHLLVSPTPQNYYKIDTTILLHNLHLVEISSK